LTKLNYLISITLYVGTSVLRWAGWATVAYSRVDNLKTTVGKRNFFGRILSNKMCAHPGLKPCRRPWLEAIC